MGKCLQTSLMDGTCQAGGWDPDSNPPIADTENYAVDEQGVCWCDDDPFPGDSCESFQTQWGWEWCDRSGELRVDCDGDCCSDYNECPDCGLQIGEDCDCEKED